ncbi:MAG: CHASE3 domain-containing protein [Methylobacter sp.]|nr:CHASE3 domain-containing protein [Methylobacter sp.]
MAEETTSGNIVTIRVLAIIEVSLGVAVLCGWAFNIETLKSILPGLPSLKVNAAICFVLCGVSLGLFAPKHPSVTALFANGLAASLAMLIGALTLAEYAFDWDVGIDQLFFNEPPGMSFTASPGRMAIIAAAMFMMRGFALLLMILRRYDLFVQWFALLSGIIALLPIGGYMFGDPLFPHIGQSSGIAPHAALGLLVLSIGILLATANRGFMLQLQPKMKIISSMLSFTLLIVSIVALLHNNQESRSATSQLQQIYHYLNLLESLQSDLFEHKAINRSYLLTGKKSLTESGSQIQTNIFKKLRQLQQQTLGQTSLQQRLNSLSSTLTLLFISTDRLIEFQQQGTYSAAALVEKSDTDHLHNDVIKVLYSGPRNPDNNLRWCPS